MTEEEYKIAYRKMQRGMWVVMLFIVPWFAGFIAIAVHYRDWFNHHPNAELLSMGVMVAGVLVAAGFVSKRAVARSKLVCLKCGKSAFLSPTGVCWECNSPLRLLGPWPWTVALMVGVAGCVVGTIARAHTVHDAVVWGAVYAVSLAALSGLIWLSRTQRRGE